MNNDNARSGLFDKLEELDLIHMRLEHTRSLMGFLGDYFKTPDPKPNDLIVRFAMYYDMFQVTDTIICEQTRALQGLLNNLWDIAKTMRRAAS